MSTLSVQNIQGVANLSITSGISFANGTTSAPAIASASNPQTGIYFPAANTIGFVEGGVEAARIDANANMTVTGMVSPGYSFMRNKIINGDMRIDQRNAGGAVTPIDGTYSIDRWRHGVSQSSKMTVQRNAGGVTPPDGYTNYLGVTSSSAYTVINTDYFLTSQWIEGYNVSDLQFGTANAKPITISFWVRSSLTGSYSFAIRNSGFNRAYVTPYTINQANTWEYKSITVPGDTTGTWLTDNGAGIRLDFAQSVGSSNFATPNTWGTAGAGLSGMANFIGTNGATWYITGVQLEAGTVATPFERRHYGQEMALCQRYYFRTVGSATSYPLCNAGGMFSTTQARTITQFPVRMRAAPTAIEQSGTASDYAILTGVGATNCSAVPTFNSASVDSAYTDFTIASGGTAGYYAMVRSTNATAYLGWNAEL